MADLFVVEPAQWTIDSNYRLMTINRLPHFYDFPDFSLFQNPNFVVRRCSLRTYPF